MSVFQNSSFLVDPTVNVQHSFEMKINSGFSMLFPLTDRLSLKDIFR